MARSKYNAVPVVIEGIRFASKKEGRRYRELKLLEKAGEIRDLELQPRFPLKVNGQSVGTYVGDFRYWDEKAQVEGSEIPGAVIVEDVKGYVTQVFKLKKKLVRALYGVEVLET